MIVVLDANVLASMAVARAGGTLATILQLWRQQAFQVAISEHIFVELQRTLGNPYFTGRLAPDDIAEYLRFVGWAGTFVSLTATVQGIATHPEDDLVLATAVSAAADYLVTGDGALRRRVPSYRGVSLIHPQEFLESLLQGDSGP